MKEEVKQLIKNKKQLEVDIYNLCLKFSNENGISVKSIETTTQTFSNQHVLLTDVRVTLDI